MDIELKTKWVEALRSGDFKQTRSEFRRERGNGDVSYCCLGVLCVVGGVEPKPTACGNWDFADTALGKNLEGKLWADQLASLNDSGAAFPEVANFIELNL